MAKIHDSILDTIGGTPLVRLNNLTKDLGAEVLVKVESFNPANSVKDRIGKAIIDAAEESGELKPGGTIVEATSGNTGIALALVGAARGYKVVLTMPAAPGVKMISAPYARSRTRRSADMVSGMVNTTL